MQRSALQTDIDQWTMIQAYLESRRTDTAAFEFFVRKLLPHRSFPVAAGWSRRSTFG